MIKKGSLIEFSEKQNFPLKIVSEKKNSLFCQFSKFFLIFKKLFIKANIISKANC